MMGELTKRADPMNAANSGPNGDNTQQPSTAHQTRPINDSTAPLKPGQQADQFLRYAITGSLLMTLLVLAILVPDLLNYRLRVAKIEASSKMSAKVPGEPGTSSGTQNTTEKKTEPPQPVSKPEPDSGPAEPKSSEIFETYGRLLTMLLAFLSVLGVFFGYFVRKSLREVEEDMRLHVTQTMEFWEKEKKRLSDEVESELKEIRTQQADFNKQQAEFNKVIVKGQKTLQAMEAALSSTQKVAGDTNRTATAVAAIDSDPSIPRPAGGD
jgi:hypothetical protein